MLLMKKAKIGTLIISALLSVSMFSIGTYAAASRVETSEFGTFSWELKKASQPGTRTYCVWAEATTSITKNYSSTSTKVIATVEVQDNLTGRTLDYRTNTNSTGPSVTVKSISNLNDTRKMAVFGCHEARGKSSIVRYTSTII